MNLYKILGYKKDTRQMKKTKRESNPEDCIRNMVLCLK